MLRSVLPGCSLVGSMAALFFSPTSIMTQEEVRTTMGSYCAPPVVPACIAELKTRSERLSACAPLADAYVASVFGYRSCLTRETERAVRQANEAIAVLRCVQKRGPCGLTPARPETR